MHIREGVYHHVSKTILFRLNLTSNYFSKDTMSLQGNGDFEKPSLRSESQSSGHISIPIDEPIAEDDTGNYPAILTIWVLTLKGSELSPVEVEKEIRSTITIPCMALHMMQKPL